MKRTEGRWHVNSRSKQAAHRRRTLVGCNTVKTIRRTDGTVALLPTVEGSLGKLRSLTADSSVDGEDNATVGLFKIEHDYRHAEPVAETHP